MNKTLKMRNDLIMIVEDIAINREILKSILEDDYEIIEAEDGEQALKLIFEDNIRPTVILLDILMPKVDGFEVIKRLKSEESTMHIPVLFITAADSSEDESRGLQAGAADYITKPFKEDIIKVRVDNHVDLARYSHELEDLVEEKTAELTKTYEQTLEILATIIEYRNLESGEHIKRTTMLTDVIIKKMLTIEKFKAMLSTENIDSLIKASALHDIGKIGIADSVLLKPGKLDKEEFDKIKTHTNIGGDIIDSIAKTLSDDDKYLKYAKEISLCHHERWDGSGYPSGLKGEEIPLSARIVAIVDVYDALTTKRCYKNAISHEESLKIIMDGAGTHFDPDISEIFKEIAQSIREIRERYNG